MHFQGTNLRERLNKQYVSHIMRKHDKRFKVVADCYPSFTEAQALSLGVLLENTEQALDRSLALRERTTAQGGIRADLKHQYFDIITAYFPGLIAEELFSVQPLQQKVGEIFFLDYILTNQKGSVAERTKAFAHDTIAEYNTYASEVIDQEFLGTGTGSKAEFAGNFSWLPVKPNSVKGVCDTVKFTDDGNNNLVGTGVSGTIDYESGAFVLTFTTEPAEGKKIEASYEYNLTDVSNAGMVPEMDLQVRSEVVIASPHKLRGTYTLDAGYDLQMSQGININDTLLEAASAQLKHETDGFLLQAAKASAASNVTFTTSTYVPSTAHVPKRDYYESFVSTITEASSKIWTATKRVRGNWIVCGKDAADILTFLGAPRFVPSGTRTAVGPHYAGTLDGTWKVYFNPFFADDEFLVGYKGDNMIDAGLIYAPYLPFFATETVMLDDFIGRRGFASSYGMKNVNSKLYVTGKIN